MNSASATARTGSHDRQHQQAGHPPHQWTMSRRAPSVELQSPVMLSAGSLSPPSLSAIRGTASRDRRSHVTEHLPACLPADNATRLSGLRRCSVYAGFILRTDVDRSNNTHTHTSGCTRKVKPIWILLKQRDSEWQWQVCTSLQTDNHASTSPLSVLQSGCPSCRPTNSVKALKAYCCCTGSNRLGLCVCVCVCVCDL